MACKQPSARSKAYEAMFRKESKEHPTLPKTAIRTIVSDHMKKKK